MKEKLIALLREKRDRMMRILIFSDLHATRITLATAEFMVFAELWLYPDRQMGQVLQTILPLEVWQPLLLLTSLLQAFYIVRGYYHDTDAIVFAGWNALLWIFMVVTYVVKAGTFPAIQIALLFSAAWVFIRSGFHTHGNRSSDYADNRRYRKRR